MSCQTPNQNRIPCRWLGALLPSHALLACVVYALISVPAHAQQSGDGIVKQERDAVETGTGQKLPFAIESQSLSSALTAFGEASGLDLLYDPDLVADIASSGVSGSMDAGAALETILAGTGLTYRFTSDNAVTIEKAHAQGEQPASPIVLSPVTVTASRFETSISDIPASVTVLDEEEIKASPTFKRDTLSAIAKSIPGASLSLNGNRPLIRGRDISFRINGVEINSKGLPTDFALKDIAPNTFDTVDTVRGADATFGIGATGAVVNFLNKEPTGGDLAAITTLGFSFQDEDVDDSFSPRASQRLEGSAGPVDFDARVNFIHGRNLFSPDGNRLPPDPAYFDSNSFSFSGTAILNIDDDQRLKTTQVYSQIEGNSKIGTIDDGDAAQGIEATTGRIPGIPGVNFDDDDRHLYVGTVSYLNEDLFGNRLDITGYYHEKEARTVPIIFDPDFYFQTRQADKRYGVRNSIEMPLEFLPGSAAGSTLTFGGDYERYQLSPFVDNASDSVAGDDPEQYQDAVGLFAQLSIDVTDDLTLSGGVRWEYQNIELTSASDRTFGGGSFEGGSTDFDMLLYNAGAVYRVTDSVSLFASFTQALDVLDFGRAQEQVSSFDQLQPEPDTTDQYEVGMRGTWRYGRGAVAAFYSESDLGQRFDPPAIQGGFAIPRREPIKIWGVEVEAEAYVTDEIRLAGSFSWSDGIVDVGDDGRWERNVFTTVPGKFGLAAEWYPTDWALGRIQVTHQLPRGEEEALDTGPIRAVTLVDLHSEFDLGLGALSFSVENLFNQTAFSQDVYVDRNTALPYPGRMFFVSYSVEW